jgi:hypothetical protein
MRSSSFPKPAAALAALAATAVLVCAPVPARADAAGDATAGVGVARISLIQGQVAVQRGDSATATAAVINAPLLGADYVTTGDASRAEVQFDATAAVRLGANVQIRFTHLDANDRALQLAEGTIDLRLLRDDAGRSQIDTPSISVRPRASGSYRVTVDGSGATQVTVRSGSAYVVTPQGAEVLAPGTTLLARGAAAHPALQRTDAIALDDFDRFNTERDAREQRALADANAPPGVTGIDDLNAYGRWVNDAGYGSVWAPSYVAPGWAPYRDGRWTWEDSYGWTWIGYEPWGWAPYHYGRWYHSRSYGWCWTPARAVVPWSPALVTFLTFGNGFDTIGWLPLAPFEPFTPWWGNGGVTIVNITTNGNFSDRRHHHRDDDDFARTAYRNAQFGGGTEISRQRFLGGRFDHPHAVAPEKLRGWQVVRGVVPVVPSDANLRFSEHPVAAPLALRATALHGTFAGEAVAPRRTPIEQQRAAIATITRAALPAVRAAQQPAVQQTAPQQPAVRRSVITPSTADAASSNAMNSASARSTHDPWARFGAERGIPVGRRVPVTDGAAPSNTASGGAAWSRFDASSAAHQNAARDSVPVQRAYGERRDAPAYAAPHSVQYAVPVAPPPQQQMQQQQPVRVAPPPARANPPSTQHVERSTQHH